MSCLPKLFAFCLLLLMTNGLPTATVDKEKESPGATKVVCYYPNWSQYRPGIGHFSVYDIDPMICTHYIFAFAKIIKETKDLGPYEANDFASYQVFNGMKVTNPTIKTLLSVGGATMGVTPFIYVVSTEANRVEFAGNVVRYLREHGFDGVDIDWEFPAYSMRDKFALLLQELQHQFLIEHLLSGQDRLLLTAALGVGNHITALDIPAVAQHIDFANVMSYNFHGTWEPFTGHHSPLFGSTEHDSMCLASAVNSYLTAGLPASKLIMGIPTYGQSYKLCNPGNHGIGDCANGHDNSSLFSDAYYEICMKIELNLYTREYDYMQQAPYIHSYGKWVSYEDLQSLSAKMDFLHTKSLGGVMFWDMSMDDFDGHCGNGNFPLINAAKSSVPSTPAPTPSPTTPTPTTPSTPVPTTPVPTTPVPTTPVPTTPLPTTPVPTTLVPTTPVPTTPVPTTPAPPNPSSTPVTPTSQPSTTTPYVPEIVCSFDGQYIRDPCDCEVYYHCANGVPMQHRCPGGLHFSITLLVCDYPGNVDCVEIC